jgi:hypothetical protein
MLRLRSRMGDEEVLPTGALTERLARIESELTDHPLLRARHEAGSIHERIDDLRRRAIDETVGRRLRDQLGKQA